MALKNSPEDLAKYSPFCAELTTLLKKHRIGEDLNFADCAIASAIGQMLIDTKNFPLPGMPAINDSMAFALNGRKIDTVAGP